MKLKPLIFSFLFVLSLSSCRVSFMPKQNAEIVANVLDIGAATSSLYDNMIASTDKNYNTFQTDYAAIDLKIAYIVDVNSNRPKAANILKQTELLKSHFDKYEADHKAKGTLNNSQLKIYRDYISSFVKPILVSELSLK